MDEMGHPKMHNFISRFHRRAIAFNYYEHDWVKLDEMKFSSPQCQFHQVSQSWKQCNPSFIQMKPISSLFINFLPCHHFCLCGTSFNVHETSMKLALRLALEALTHTSFTWAQLLTHLALLANLRVPLVSSMCICRLNGNFVQNMQKQRRYQLVQEGIVLRMQQL